MSRKMITLCCTLALAGFVIPANASARCKHCETIEAKGEGFCDECNTGLAFNVKLTDRSVYDLVAGNAEMFQKARYAKCSGCVTAAKSEGQCKRCDIYVAQGKVYKTAAPQAVAKGKPIKADMHTGIGACKECTTQLAANGYCTGCNLGFVGGHIFNGREAYDAAKKAHTTITLAASDAARCTDCATARLTDGTCTRCNVAFKDGMQQKS